jgi:hypothetical protein
MATGNYYSNICRVFSCRCLHVLINY